MLSFLEMLWGVEVRLLPLIAALVVFELSNVVRRLTHIAYTPIYFAFFPLGHADSHYAYYFNEDEMYVGESMNKEEKAALRLKIVSISSFSIAFSTIFNPALAGIFSALFLTQTEFNTLFWVLLIGKAVLVTKSLYDNRYTSFVEASGAYPWLCVIYVVFLATVVWVLNETYVWANISLQAGGLPNLANDLWGFFIGKLVIGLFIAAVVGGAISQYMTNPAFIPSSVDVEDELD